MDTKKWFNDMALALQEKLKTTEKMLPSQFPDKIREITGGGGGGATMVIEHPGGWSGTTVPNEGYIEKIYFNTNLPDNEVIALLSNPDLPVASPELPLYVIAVSDGQVGGLLSMSMNGMLVIADMATKTYYYIGGEVPEGQGPGFIGWNPDIDFSSGIVVNGTLMQEMEGLVAGQANHLLTSLISTTPIEMLIPETEKIEIEGELNGAPVTITDEELEGGWQGTVVPNTGVVENIYFNTNLTVEEVVALLEQLTYLEDVTPNMHFLIASSDETKAYSVYKNEKTDSIGNAIVAYAIFDSEEKLLFSNIDDFENGIPAGWNADITYPIAINSEVIADNSMGNIHVSIGAENDKLVTLFSTTPFVKIEANTIDILEYIEKEKLPNKINLDIEDKMTPLLTGKITKFVDNKITRLRGYAFAGCIDLSEVSIPNCSDFGSYTFKNCYKLQKLKINSEATKTVPSGFFADCYNYDYSYIRDLSTIFSNCTRINSEAFNNCGLIEASFSECTYIGSSAFRGNDNLSAISFPKCKIVGNYAFYGCPLNSSIYFPKCLSIGHNAFAETYSNSNDAMKIVDLPLCNNIGAYAFQFRPNLSSINAPFCEDIGASAFYQSPLTNAFFPACVNLARSVFSSTLKNLTFSPATIAPNNFHGNTKLSTLYLLTNSCILAGNNAFTETPIASGTGSIYVPSNAISWYQSASNWSAYSSQFVALPSEYDTQYVYAYEFANSTITEVPSEKTNAQYVLNQAFYNCSNLTIASFPMCSYIGNYAFSNCTTLTTANFPVCVYIGYYAFSNCKSLTTMDFPELLSIERSFAKNFSNLTTINAPKCEYIGYEAFRGCISLTEVNFLMCSEIDFGVFSGCTSLTSANFPNCISIGNSAFANCTSLTTASFPMCEYVENSIFYGCTNLSSLYLVNSSKMISIPYTNYYLFENTPIANGTGKIYVHKNQYDNYINDTYWKRQVMSTDQFVIYEE